MTDRAAPSQRPAQAGLLTVPEIVRAARAALPPPLWEHAAGGTETETTLRRNRLAMESYAFRPRLLRGVEAPDLRTTLLGQPLASPVLLAPIGSIGAFHPEGQQVAATVAARRGIVDVVGLLTAPALDELAAAATGPGRHILQVYVRGDRGWLAEIAARAEAAGYLALCITADSTGAARRERDLHNRFARAWTAAPRPNLPPDGGSRTFQERFTWADFAWLRSVCRLPLILKGVMSEDDAVRAVEHGADAVYVSNHGGRELDHLPATLEVLPEVVAAVGGRAEVLVDGGFLHGSDVVKALALGARAVLLGKLQVWAIAAGGAPLLERALDILDAEVADTMQLLGASHLADLGPATLRPSLPTRLSGPAWDLP